MGICFLISILLVLKWLFKACDIFKRGAYLAYVSSLKTSVTQKRPLRQQNYSSATTDNATVALTSR